MEELFAVDWKSAKLPAKGAVIEPAANVRDFIKKGFGTDFPVYLDEMSNLDCILLVSSVGVVPDDVFSTPDGKTGLKAEYFNQSAPTTVVASRIEPNINKDNPLKQRGLDRDITVVWTGNITLKESGSYIFCGDFAGQVSVWLDGKQVMKKKAGTRRKDRFGRSDLISLEAGKAYEFKVEQIQDGGRGQSLELFWKRQLSKSHYDRILERVANDGTTLIVSGNETFSVAEELGKRGIVKYTGFMKVDRWWKAGGLFAVEHPLFKDLPQNTGMNWEYQDTAKYEMTINSAGEFKKEYDGKRYGLLLEGEEVAGFCTNGHEHKVASTVSVLSHGKGKIVLSCLDLYPYLTDDRKSANSLKKILCNYMEYAVE